MRTPLILVMAIFALVLAGCGNDPAKAVVGTWKPDVNSLKVDMGAKGNNPAAKQQLDAMMPALKESIGKASITFNADGTFKGMNPDEKASSGKYTVSGNTVTVTPDQKDSKAPEPTFTVGPDGKTMLMHMSGNGMTMDLNLVKA